MTAAPLTQAGEYRCEVAAGVARIWENVWDWEHLAGLHADSFAAVRLLNRDRDGWRVALSLDPDKAEDRRRILKLWADKPGGRYVVTTEAGPGAGTEIRTELTAITPHRTGVHVRFLLPVPEGPRAVALGAAYARSYAKLWDEDEAMMQRREALSDLPPDAPEGVLDLGERAAVLARAPYTLDWQGRPVRIAVSEGALIAFTAVCPHWLGPLDEMPVEGGCVACPWHNYRFDVRTGDSVDGRGLRLTPLYDLSDDGGRVRLRAREPAHG